MAAVTNSYRNWRPIKVGAGGWIVGFDQHSDGTLVCRTDTYGAYLYDSVTGIWSQLVTTSSMPAADEILGNGAGVYEIRIAPSDSNIMYMLYIGRLYRTANKGTTWTLCAGWTAVSNLSANAGSHARYTGERLCIDPLDANVVYIGTMDQGLWRTFDGGATACTLITDVPVGIGSAGGTEPGITGIVIDPSAAAVSGRSGTIWASSHGEGYYRSTDGGINWTEPAGFGAYCVMHAAMTSTGKLYCTEYFGDASPNTVWRNVGGTWTELTHANITTNANRLHHTIAIDPNDEDRILLGTAGGYLLESLDGGDTFGTIRSNVISNESSSDIPWLENGWGTPGRTDPYMSSGDMRFSKVSGETNRLLFSEGIGFWNATLAPGFTTVPWVSMSRGIEQLVANQITALPDGRIFLASWDRPIFEITNPEIYPSSYIFKDKYLNHCMAVEYVRANPDIMAAGMYYSDSIFTTDGWETYTEVVSPPESAFTTGGGQGELVPFSATKFIWIQVSAQGIWYSDDTCQTWTRVSLEGMAEDATSAGWLGFGSGYWLRRRCCAPDGLTDGMGYLWHDTAGIYKTTNHGESWTRVFTGQLHNFSNSNKKLRCTPGVEGHLWVTIGDQSNTGAGAFKRSTDGGANWSTIADVTEVKDFGFGAIKSGSTYPRLWIIGWVNGTAQANFGIYYSDDEGVTWTRVLDGAFPLESLDGLVAIDGDKVDVNKAYVGFNGSGYTYTNGHHAGEPEGHTRFLLNNS